MNSATLGLKHFWIRVDYHWMSLRRQPGIVLDKTNLYLLNFFIGVDITKTIMCSKEVIEGFSEFFFKLFFFSSTSSNNNFWLTWSLLFTYLLLCSFYFFQKFQQPISNYFHPFRLTSSRLTSFLVKLSAYYLR